MGYDEIDHDIDKDMGWTQGRRKPSPRRGPDYWQALLRTARASSPLWRGLRNLSRSLGKVFLFPIISPLGYTKHFDINGDMMIVKRSFLWRLADAVLTRVLLAPVILAIFLIAVVYASTHPRNVRALGTPDAYGTYFSRVNLVTVDNQRLTAWYIPALTADEVAFDPEGTLAQKWPSVVLCHGLGATHDQYLPLAQEMHKAGFAVLMIDMRGQGESDVAAVTFGLRERLDVLAGVKFLRETSSIDPGKVCVVGHNIGGMAALQAATLDSSITAIVADGLWPRFEERARDIFSRPTADTWGVGGSRLPTAWMAPLYTLTFEIAVRDRLSQLDPGAIVRNLHRQPVLFIARTGPEYAPVRDIMNLASTAGSQHDVFVDNPGSPDATNARIRDFLLKTTKWKGPKAHGIEQIQKLLENQVK